MKKRWTFEVGKASHTVTCSDETGDMQITLDGQPVQAQAKLGKTGTAYGFTMGKNRLTLIPNKSGTSYALLLNGERVRTSPAPVKDVAQPLVLKPSEEGAIFRRHHNEAAAREAHRVSVRQFVPDWTWLFTLALLLLLPTGYFHGLAFVLFIVGTVAVIAVANTESLTRQQQYFVAWFITLVLWAAYITMGSMSVVPCRVTF